MRDLLRRNRPTPGTVLGAIAVIVALAGTALAGPLAENSALTKKEKKQTRNLAKAEIAKAAPNLSVKSAQSANTAAEAANAGTVDGHDATCPPATFLRSGVCFDNAARSDIGYITAVQDCADTGGRLPSIGELQSIRALVDLGPAGDGHWADVMYDDDGTASAMSVYGAAGAVETQAVSGLRPYRCAYPLVR